MTSEQVLTLAVRRYVIAGDRPFQELPGGGTRIAYDSVVSAIEGYGDPESLKVAEHLDDEVLTLLRSAV